MPELDHLDCNRSNPKANNLEWVTHEENVKRVKERGRLKSEAGEANGNSKLTRNTVDKIRYDYMNNIPKYKLSQKYNIPWSTVHNIVTFNTWK